MAAQFNRDAISGVREEPQLREQDFGSARTRRSQHSWLVARFATAPCAHTAHALLTPARPPSSPCAADFQDSTRITREKAERNAYGRFFYRFPNGESGSDVYDRITLFEDHMARPARALHALCCAVNARHGRACSSPDIRNAHAHAGS